MCSWTRNQCIENNERGGIREKMVTDYFDVKLETKDLILKKAEFEG